MPSPNWQMQSQGRLSEIEIQEQVKQFIKKRWENLNYRLKDYAKKAWRILTYKWRWQIAMNIPYLAIFILDRTIPTVHQFDIKLINYITSKLPISSFISSLIGLN